MAGLERLGIALLIVGVIAWVGLWLRLARRFLVRDSAASPRPLETLSVETHARRLYPSLEVTRVASACRTRVVEPGLELDVAATVDNTVRHGGFFSPVLAPRRVFPEYLALIDRTTHQDQQAALVDDLLDQLGRRGVWIDRYYFDGDPRLCFPQHASDEPTTLALLAPHFRRHRLLIFADTRVFVDRLTGRLAAWVDELDTWPARALFVPGRPVDAL